MGAATKPMQHRALGALPLAATTAHVLEAGSKL